MPRDLLIKLRNGTASAWTSANPLLANGEAGYETDAHKLKIGDGTTYWTSLAYIGTGLADADYGDITVSSSATIFTIDNDVVSNAKLANMAQSTIKGRAVSAGTGDPTDLTATQATAILDVFSSSLKGLAPSSGGGTTNYLRADGSWAAPPGGTGTTNLTSAATATTNVVYSDTGTDATLVAASGTDAGLMLPAQYTKLSYITVTQAVNLDDMELDISQHQTLLGVADGSTHLGTFTGTTIADSVTVKAAIQSLETAVETKLDKSLTSAYVFVGNGSNVATGVAVSGDATLANTGALTIANNAISNAKLADMSEALVIGREIGAGTGDPTYLTRTQVTALLNIGTASLQGAAPAAGTPVGNFLRDDWTWATGVSGPAGADGADGLGWTGGSYNSGTGVVTFTSTDGLGFSTGDLRGATGATGAAGTNGTNGTNGATGAAGVDAGFKYTYSTTTTASDPGSGTFRLNNATLSSATALYISETDSDSVSLSTWLATLDDSTSTVRGFLTFRKDGASSNFRIYSVSGTLTDNGTWDTLTIAHVSGSGSWSNADTIRVTFARTGDKGDTGSAGATGTTGNTGATGSQGPATFTWNVSGGMTQTSQSQVTKSSATASWGEQAYSTEGHVNNCFVSFRTTSTTLRFAMGLNSDPTTDANITSLDYAYSLNGPGSTATVYVNGASTGTSTAITTSTVLAITYDGEYVRFWADSTLVYLVARSPGTALYLDSSFYDQNASAVDVHFGPGGGSQGPATFTWNASAGIALNSRTQITKILGGTGWNHQGYSTEGYVRGCFLTYRTTSVGGTSRFMLGLNSDPTTDASYTSIDYAFYVNVSAGNAQVWLSGSYSGYTTAITTSTVLAITYDGEYVRFWANSTLVHTVSRAIGSALYLDSSFYDVGASATDIHFGPMGSAGLIADIAESRVLGRAVGAGTGQPVALTPQQLRLVARQNIYALTFATTQNWDLNNGLIQTVTATNNFTLQIPSNAAAGETAYIYVTQDGTGSRTIAFASGFKAPGGIASIVLSTAASSVDRLELFFRSASIIDVNVSKAFS